jgi:hypothetical protein
VTAVLTLETSDQENLTPSLGGGAVLFTPAVNEDYWRYRVRLTETQAVLGFPKFSTIGIGFAVEEDWNTNLPYNCPTDDILKHIISNKGDDKIVNADVREAILMIQMAVIADRVAKRREEFNKLRQATEGVPAVPVGMLDAALTMAHTSMREIDMLTAEVAALRSRLAPAPAPEPNLAMPYEWCTTWARRRRHISSNLTTRRSHPGAQRGRAGTGAGRAGRTLCGTTGAMDAAAVERELSLWGTRRKPFVLADLPACALCVKGLPKGMK